MSLRSLPFLSPPRIAGALLALAPFALTSSPAGTIDFSDVPLTKPPAETYAGPGGGVFYRGADGAGGFTSGGAAFATEFTDWGGGFTSWAGWAWSTTSDATTAGFGNEFSAYPGSGDGDAAYAVAFPSYDTGNPTLTLASGFNTPLSVSLANTTYAALAMRDGYFASKQFGGATGTDADWFLLTITGRDAGGSTTGTVEFYLADFRFADSAQDYILGTWSTVDLTPLGSGVRTLEFAFSSSDNGTFGMNTPAYFALDNLTAIPEPATTAALLGVLTLASVVGVRRRSRR